MLLVICLLAGTPAFAQKNIIKGRAIYLPFQDPAYSFGLGYERFLAEKWSVQILFNSTQVTPGNDASTKEAKGFVPEVRYYFGKQESIRKKWFFAGFSELYWVKSYGGMPSYSKDYYWVEQNGLRSTFGVLIGKNVAIGKHFLVDLYFGGRIKVFSGEDKYKYFYTGEYFYKDTQYTEFRARAGMNLGFAF